MAKNITGNLIERIQAAGQKQIQCQSDLAQTAATLEAARILGDEITDIAKQNAPMMLRGYMDNKYAKAVLMNAVMVGVETAFPDLPEDHVYKQVASAAVVVAYQEAIQSFNIQDMIKDLFSGEKMTAAVAKLKGKAAAAKEA